MWRAKVNNSSALSLWLFKQRFKLVKPRTQSWETSLSSTGVLATLQTQETTLILGSSSVPVVWSIDHRHHVGASFFKNFDFPEESQMRSPGDFYAHKSLRWSCLWDYKLPRPLGKLRRFFSSKDHNHPCPTDSDSIQLGRAQEPRFWNASSWDHWVAKFGIQLCRESNKTPVLSLETEWRVQMKAAWNTQKVAIFTSLFTKFICLKPQEKNL